jgi:hypothetical protein
MAALLVPVGWLCVGPMAARTMRHVFRNVLLRSLLGADGSSNVKLPIPSYKTLTAWRRTKTDGDGLCCCVTCLFLDLWRNIDRWKWADCCCVTKSWTAFSSAQQFTENYRESWGWAVSLSQTSAHFFFAKYCAKDWDSWVKSETAGMRFHTVESKKIPKP